MVVRLYSMKRFVILAAMAALALSGCKKAYTGEDEKVYTEQELGVIIERLTCGWCEVKNETGATVKLTTSYPFGYHEDITSEIVSGESVKLDIGSAAPGVSIGESNKAVISLADGTEIVCVPSEIMTPWAEHFYSNYEKEETYEVTDFGGKKLRLDLVILTYHIDQALIDLWKESQEMPYGLWPPIQLDRPEAVLPSTGGTVVVSMLNYTSWWINGGYSAEPDEEGVWRPVEDYIFSTSSDGEETCTYDILEGGWFHAVVPNKGQSHQLIIAADENYLAKPRHAIIEMECGDVFTSIKVTQP